MYKKNIKKIKKFFSKANNIENHFYKRNFNN